MPLNYLHKYETFCVPTSLLTKFYRMMAVPRAASTCEPADPSNTLTDRLNTLLNSSGSGYVLSLCPSTQYLIQAPILFASPNQEISTLGYPTDNSRAVLVVNGPVSNGTGHTTAVDGTCANCGGVRLRNVQVNMDPSSLPLALIFNSQINGTRAGAPPTTGGANIEMGGPNSGQLIEYVHSYDPRGWSCLHVAEGSLNCNNTTVQNNDIGPAGSDLFQQWADGISVACSNSLVRNNMVNNPTDGGIVLFGSPGTRVENNTIWVETVSVHFSCLFVSSSHRCRIHC
jgi:parallel beta-helix repeat protein